MKKESLKIKDFESALSKLTSAACTLKVLNELAITSFGITDTNEKLKLILTTAINSIGACAGSVHLLTCNKEEPIQMIIERQNNGSIINIPKNIVRWLISSKKALIIDKLSEDSRFSPGDQGNPEITSVLGVPVWYEGDIIGIMILVNKYKKKLFSEDDLRLFCALAVQAGQHLNTLSQKSKDSVIKKYAQKTREPGRIKIPDNGSAFKIFRASLTKIMIAAQEIMQYSENFIIEGQANIIFETAQKLDSLIIEESKTSGTAEISSQMKIRNNHKPLLLVIQNNYVLRTNIIKTLRDYYSIAEASDGYEGVQKCFEMVPDMIIIDTDVPGMEVTRLCNYLKSDLRSSHIPLIILTEKTTSEDQLFELRYIGDDFIIKPFKMTELKNIINRHFRQKQIIHQEYKNNGYIPDEEKISVVDLRFLNTTFSIISKHSAIADFSAEELSRLLSVSGVLLYKKLTSLIDETPDELIERIRSEKHKDQ